MTRRAWVAWSILGFISLLLLKGIFLEAVISSYEGEKKRRVSDTITIAETPFVDSLTIELEGRDSLSAFELLRESHQVDFTSSAMGVFVKGIDSVYPGEHSSWMYSVNDSMGKIASDKYLTGDGDRVRWHLRRWTK
jgi:Domain of unknown function (DUF4430)